MRAGELRHRITIKSKSAARDDYGQETITWTTFATVWGFIRPSNGREYIAGEQVDAAIDTDIKIRYLAGVLPSMQAVWGSHTYEIVGPPNFDRRLQEMHLMCREVL